ncbi:MAG: NUDIX domain-containing protein [Dysgonamonadaceae bacterium]|jgi:isopentenyldiphosphate isomerase|nr:NUDIX domain-containing protein [Dysgonamonadaceae bacterium]
MPEEIFPLVDESGQVVGQATRSLCHSGGKALHPVVHLHVFNSQGNLLLQKRAANKDIQPGKWDTSVGGHMDFGESVEAALYREAGEELGIENFIPEFLQSYIFESDVEKELVYSYKTVYDGTFLFEKKEIDQIRFWSVMEIKNTFGKSVFTPNFEYEFRRIFLKSL